MRGEEGEGGERREMDRLRKEEKDCGGGEEGKSLRGERRGGKRGEKEKNDTKQHTHTRYLYPSHLHIHAHTHTLPPYTHTYIHTPVSLSAQHSAGSL